MTTPNQYIGDCVKKFDEKYPEIEHYVQGAHYNDRIVDLKPDIKSHLTSSLNGLLELIEKEIEGRMEAHQKLTGDFSLEANIHMAASLSDLSTWLKSIK